MKPTILITTLALAGGIASPAFAAEHSLPALDEVTIRVIQGNENVSDNFADIALPVIESRDTGAQSNRPDQPGPPDMPSGNAEDGLGRALENVIENGASENAAQVLENAAGNASENAADAAGNASENAADAAGNASENAADAAGNASENAADAAGNASENAAENAADAAGNAAENAADAADNASENAADAAENAADNAANAPGRQ